MTCYAVVVSIVAAVVVVQQLFLPRVEWINKSKSQLRREDMKSVVLNVCVSI